MEEARSYALKLANGPEMALAYIKRCVYEGLEKPLAEGLELERGLIAKLFATEDAREGLTAFVEKRKPQFKGR
jgi:enoyl-CoA hydratase/carnithine racemase